MERARCLKPVMQGNSGNGAFAAAPRAAADVEQVERVQVGVRTGESGRGTAG